MAALTIPQQQRLGLARLRALEDADVVKIVEAFRSMPKTEMKRKTLVPAVAEALPKLPADDIANIANTLTSLYYVRANADVPLASFAVDVCEALRDLGGQQFKFTDQEFAQFQGRLVKLLDVDPLALGAKTWALRADYENTFFEAKTLTDIRPVFGSSVEDSPVGFVLTHTLRIGYHDNSGEHRHFYIALDQEDLTTLRNALERADKKGKSLKPVMDKTGIPRLDVE